MQLDSFPFLDTEEVHRAVQLVYSLRSYWSKKGDVLYTLGEAIYQNTRNMNNYYNAAEYMNPILWDNFFWLYKRLSQMLTQVLKESVLYYNQIALPGFHIFAFENIREYSGGGAHFDLQYQSLSWPTEAVVSFENPISFTLALELPTSSAGIDLWDLTYEEMISRRTQNSTSTTIELAKDRPYTNYPYRLGQLVIFYGHVCHRISQIDNLKPSDRRITLQGHVIKVNGIWIAYW